MSTSTTVYRPDHGQVVRETAHASPHWDRVRQGLEWDVKVFRLLEEGEDDAGAAAVATKAALELARLREAGALDRVADDAPRVDLFRHGQALDAATARARCPAACELVSRLDARLADLGYFLWRLRCAPARASSTTRADDRSERNLHFDASDTPKAEYDDPIFQVMLNLGQRERQFFFVPCTYAEMERRLRDRGSLAADEIRRLAPREVLHRFFRHHAPLPVTVPVPFGHACAFAAGIYAHDAAKGVPGSAGVGPFLPSTEDDFTAALLPLSEDGGGVAERPFFPEDRS